MVSLVLDRLPIGRLCRFVSSTVGFGRIRAALRRPFDSEGLLGGNFLAVGLNCVDGGAVHWKPWSLVGCILLLSQPHLIYNLSFQLSFVAAGGIILGPSCEILRLPQRVFRPIASSLYISTIAQLS